MLTLAVILSMKRQGKPFVNQEMKDLVVVNSVNAGAFAFVTLTDASIIVSICVAVPVAIYNIFNALNAYHVYQKNKEENLKK